MSLVYTDAKGKEVPVTSGQDFYDNYHTPHLLGNASKSTYDDPKANLDLWIDSDYFGGDYYSCEWWIYQDKSNPKHYLLMFEWGDSDKEAGDHFVRAIMTRFKDKGAKLLSTYGGSPDYLNDPGILEFEYKRVVGPRGLAGVVQNINKLAYDGLMDQVGSIADDLIGSRGAV